ncbi:MAG TPA: GlsB/YeaQ/YmgE family stress response membrane protein [Candidatus Krumholzibacteria bacterium]|nr:GlsB/YeaQ/YmgE family stress response membrane protein [Candidatus Krumholzibacteria bacterium]HPD72379.1 GlsB/YeaQ/YmgE family stress response membrane protein [Candidatus Krumholzibacteria bacterium]HRY40689.1 GlsB/YeaQ/YmgE family stress response membrane protein [Candidatus Krumholzibacteria bacterium]
MGILSWIVMGLIVGVIAKFIMPGKDPGGIIVTILLGIAGAFVGGFIGSALGLGTITGFNFGSFLLSIAGAILLLILYRLIKKKPIKPAK